MPILESPIAQHAKDEIPSTWKALTDINSEFGEEALGRRLNRVIRLVFGNALNNDQQEALDIRVQLYLSKLLVLDLIRPGVDFWSKQVLSISAGERESKAYAQRAEELKEMREGLLAEATDLLMDIQPLLPVVTRRVKDAPRVIQAGENIEHLTTDPYAFPPLYAPAEEIAATDV
jgi:hypothetical protein